MLAAEKGHVNCISTLASAGADMDLQRLEVLEKYWHVSFVWYFQHSFVCITQDGQGALHIACRNENPNCVKALLHFKAAPNLQDNVNNGVVFISLPFSPKLFL